MVFLVIFIIAKIGYSSSLIFYDSMLGDVTEEERMDQVSSHGFAWGYIGSCIPFAISLVVVLGADSFGLTMPAAMMTRVGLVLFMGTYFLSGKQSAIR